jgi:CarD family transcriptional regulator
MLQFRVGDKAVYPTQGVAEVIGIEEKEISGKSFRFYSLKLIDSGLRILVPLDKAEQVGLRQVVSERQIREVFEILAEKDIPVDKQTWNRRYRGFMEKLKTGSLYEVAEVYRDLSRLKANKPLSFGERKMLDAARSLLLKELSIARKTTENMLETEIAELLAS